MKTALLPPSAFLPSVPVRLPVSEPRKSATKEGYFLSDRDPDNAVGHLDVYPFPVGAKVKWLTQREIVTELVSTGYDEELAGWAFNRLRDYSYIHLHSYYMHKEQARRNLARQRAREAAEKLVGKQTPPQQTPPEQEGD